MAHHFGKLNMLHLAIYNLRIPTPNLKSLSIADLTDRALTTLRIHHKQLVAFNKPLYFHFMVFKEAFDYLDRNVMLKILSSYDALEIMEPEIQKEVKCYTTITLI